jgi:hypothetical protein
MNWVMPFDNDLNEVKRRARLLLHIFYAKIAKRKDWFDIDVCNEICDKLLIVIHIFTKDVVVKDREKQ